MVKNFDTIPDEQENVDNYIITACIALIAGFAVILTVEPPHSLSVACASVLSLLGLIASLLASLWHKSRAPIRRQFFAHQRDLLLNQTAKQIANFAETFIFTNPTACSELSRAKEQGLGETGSESQTYGPYTQQAHSIIMAHLENLGNAMRSLHLKAFHMSLDEPKGKLKFHLDIWSRRLRYFSFVIGILSFFVVVLLIIIDNSMT